MSDAFETVAPAFIEMAHQIVWATVATVRSVPGSVIVSFHVR